MKYVYAILVFAVFAGLFILIYYLNSKTKKPEGCEELPEECVKCKVTLCNRNPNKEKKEN